MFTGIISHLGKLISLEKKDTSTLTIEANLPDTVSIGESVAVNGACLTVSDIRDGSYTFQLSRETLNISNFTDLNRGTSLNLELPLRLNDFLGGHLVSGHLDGVARAKSVRGGTNGSHFSFVYREFEWRKFLIHKGSITLNGVSLTLSQVQTSQFSVEIIPQTLKTTNLKHLKAGERVNMELDLIGKYLYNFRSNQSHLDVIHER